MMRGEVLWGGKRGCVRGKGVKGKKRRKQNDRKERGRGIKDLGPTTQRGKGAEPEGRSCP